MLQSYWFIKSDHLGKLGVGRQSQASDNTAILVDGSGSLVPANWVAFDVNTFTIYDKNGAPVGLWGNFGSCRGMGGAWGDCNGLTRNAVRYDTPTFHGFSMSASWGDDDFWDVAARFSGESNGFKLAVAAAYNEWTDGNTCSVGNTQDSGNAVLNALGVTCITGSNSLSGPYPDPGSANYFQVGAYVEHVPTGLWALINYGHLDDSLSALPTTDTWYFKAGLRERWHPLGHTVLYGEYLTNNDGNNNSFCGPVDEACNSVYDSDLHVWGLGVVQEIDAAAMSLWVSYRHIDADLDGIGCASAAQTAAMGLDVGCGTEAFQYIKAGALINF